MSQKNPKQVINNNRRATYMLKCVFLGQMENIRGCIGSEWDLYFRVIIFYYHSIWLRSAKNGLFGLMDTVRGSIIL